MQINLQMNLIGWWNKGFEMFTRNTEQYWAECLLPLTYRREPQGDSTPTIDYRKGHIRMLRHGDTTLQDVFGGDAHKRDVNRLLVI